MHSNYKRHRLKALSERGRMMARVRWQRDRERRDSEQAENVFRLREIEVTNLPCGKGDMLGVLQWQDAATGKVRRWVIRIGDRADRITIESPGGECSRSHGWAWFFSSLRKKILGS